MLHLSQRPLTASAADAELFVDRSSELRRITQAVDLRLNCLLVGERGSGRTSLLRQVERRLREADASVVFVDAEQVADVQRLVEAVVQEAASRPIDGGDRFPSLHAALDRAGAWLADGTVVLVDDVAPEVAFELFGRHRDELWEIGAVWVVSGSIGSRGRYLQPPADAFFDAVVELGELSEEASRDLLLRRAEHARPGDAAATRIFQSAAALARDANPRTPRVLLAAARAVVLGERDDHRALARVAAMQQEAGRIGRAATMLLTELLDRGPVSASDEDLQRSLGWTRPRIVQVLKQLEGANLVVATTQPGRTGRPRTLYAVNVDYRGADA